MGLIIMGAIDDVLNQVGYGSIQRMSMDQFTGLLAQGIGHIQAGTEEFMTDTYINVSDKYNDEEKSQMHEAVHAMREGRVEAYDTLGEYGFVGAMVRGFPELYAQNTERVLEEYESALSEDMINNYQIDADGVRMNPVDDIAHLLRERFDPTYEDDGHGIIDMPGHGDYDPQRSWVVPGQVAGRGYGDVSDEVSSDSEVVDDNKSPVDGQLIATTGPRTSPSYSQEQVEAWNESYIAEHPDEFDENGNHIESYATAPCDTERERVDTSTLEATATAPVYADREVE